MITAVLSDIHGRLASFKNVIADDAFRRAERVFLLGDLAGWGGQSEACAGLWLKIASRIPCCAVAGNHELLVIGRLGKGRFVPEACESLEEEQDSLSAEVGTFLSGLPATMTCGDALLCHGSPSDPCEYLTSTASIQAALKKAGKIRWLMAGHTHLPMAFDGKTSFKPKKDAETFRFEGDGPFFLNPGSVGLPRDGRRGASYCLLDDKRREAEFRRIIPK